MNANNSGAQWGLVHSAAVSDTYAAQLLISGGRILLQILEVNSLHSLFTDKYSR